MAHDSSSVLAGVEVTVDGSRARSTRCIRSCTSTTCPSRILTKIASMNTTGYTASSGRLHNSVISPITLSVIRLMLSLDTVAP